MIKEIEAVTISLEHIKDIISAQQVLSGVYGRKQFISLENALEEALLIADLDFKHVGITIIKHYHLLNPVLVDKAKLIQILVNFLKNARDALINSSATNKTITLETVVKDNKTCCIKVQDNGIGIAPEDKTHIFMHDFTTKKSGHGFSLHSSALAAKEIGGKIKVESTLKQGSTFILELPYETKH